MDGVQGFPRDDLDIGAVRLDRQRVNHLTNDHKAITSKIEELLHRIHQQARLVPLFDLAMFVLC